VGRRFENTGFRCAVCERDVRPLTNGSYRNHCPFCLSSLHVDVTPGDRRETCDGVMVAVDVKRSRKGLQIVHECERCGVKRVNRVAQDSDQSDDPELLGLLMAIPGDKPSLRPIRGRKWA
jgi:DNA-directed RNA polymerase subunit RPC12/RpoP